MPLPAWAPVAAEFGTKLLGSVFGDDDPGFGTQLNDQRRAAREMIPEQLHAEAKAKDEISKQYGIHPMVLFGSGMNSGYSPSFQYNNDPGFDYEGMGQNIGRLAETVSGATERGVQRQMTDLQLERMQLENTLLASQISSVNRTMIPPRPGADHLIPGQSGSVVNTKYGPIQIDNTHRSFPRHSYLHEADGRVTPILNPESGDNEILMLWDFIKHTAPAELRNMYQRDPIVKFFKKFRR